MSINFGIGITNISLFWTSFKQIVISKSLLMQYTDDGSITTVFAFDGSSLAYVTNMWDNGNVPSGIQSTYSISQNNADLSDFQNNFQATSNKSIATTPFFFQDTANLTSFGRLRVANPLTLFSSKQLYDSQPLYWDDQQTSGSGTSSSFLSNNAATQLLVTQNIAGTHVRQSFRRMNYQPGKAALSLFTGVLVAEGGSGNAAVNRRIGLFDGYNGYFFELTGTTMNVALRTNASGAPVTTYIPQNLWSVDKFDGYGRSGIALNVANAQIFVIDFQWLGVGRIRYGFDINGETLYCHEILIANNQNLVSISVPNLPCRFELQSLGTGGSSTSTMQHICSTVTSEGGQEDVGFVFGIDSGSTALVTNNDTNVYAALIMQLQNGYLGATIEPQSFTAISTTTNASFKVVLVLNPTIAGTALSYNPVAHSAMQFAIGGISNTITGGTTLYSGYFTTNKIGSATDKLTIDVALGSNIMGISDILVMALQPVPAAANTFYMSMNYKEQI